MSNMDSLTADFERYTMKRNIIIINPGPVYHFHSESYQERYKGLSRFFKGYILTTANKNEKIIMGGFEFLALGKTSPFIANFLFFVFCISNAIKLKRSKKKIALVITYDPIKTGFIGWVVSCILSSKLIIEVNGVYTSEAEWFEIENPLVRYLKKKIVFGLIRFNLKHADGVKLLFDSQIDPFSALVPDKLITVYSEYVPVALFKPLKEKKEILFAGFPFKRKGVDVLIKAFKKISSRHSDWKLVILGWYPDPKELYSAIDGHKQIEHLKPVTYDKMPEYIGSCGILVLPSRSEAMGRVLVEAMAAGKPRVGSNVDGIPTVINHGVDGLLVQPENVDALADSIEQLIDNADLRKSMGKAAAGRAKREFTVSVYADNCEKFYTSVINSPDGR